MWTTRSSALALLLLGGVAGCARRPATARDGQWIWSSADATVLAEARPARPRTTAGVWVATVGYDTTALRPLMLLALSPGIAPSDSAAAVIRFDDTFTAAWRRQRDDALARDLAVRFDTLLAVLGRQRVPVQEVQLDYDAPVRQLPRWARLAGRLADGPLAGREVWVTSIVAHLRDPDYGGLFRGRVAGHILQLFDTGERADGAALAEVERVLARARLPFRVGLGAFERRRADGTTTQHRWWFGALPRLRRLDGWRGLWIFPGGERWASLVRDER